MLEYSIPVNFLSVGEKFYKASDEKRRVFTVLKKCSGYLLAQQEELRMPDVITYDTDVIRISKN